MARYLALAREVKVNQELSGVSRSLANRQTGFAKPASICPSIISRPDGEALRSWFASKPTQPAAPLYEKRAGSNNYPGALESLDNTCTEGVAFW